MNPDIFAIILLFLYFLPTGLSARGSHGSVFVINLFFGWTLIGWVIALAFAIRSREMLKMDEWRNRNARG